MSHGLSVRLFVVSKLEEDEGEKMAESFEIDRLFLNCQPASVATTMRVQDAWTDGRDVCVE